jgi:pimeloyl-ACP methyl ester carboxylesterase
VESASTPEPSIVEHKLKLVEFVFDYRAAGPEDGELVLLLHGFPQTSYSFCSQLRALPKAGYRAVAPDQRGYSPGARALKVNQYGIALLAAEAMQIASELGHERFPLVGHDWGGAVAWLAAALNPKRLLSLSMLSTPHISAMGAQRSDPDSEYVQGYYRFQALEGKGHWLPEEATTRVNQELLAHLKRATKP